MGFGNIEKNDDTESKMEQEQPEKKEFEEPEEKQSFGDKLKESFGKLFHKEGSESSENIEDSEKTENVNESKEKEDSENGDKPKNQILDNNDSRREMREQKLEEYDSKLFDSVKKHGEMLEGRSDLSPEEKNDMQAEMTDNYKKAVAEYKDWLENESDYRDLPEE